MNITEQLYMQYVKEFSPAWPAYTESYEEFRERVSSALADARCVTVSDSLGEGVMFYYLRKEAGMLLCRVPVFGYACSSERALSELFCRMSELVLRGGAAEFSVELYARDTAAQRLFSMMQFGFMAEKGLCPVSALLPEDGDVRNIVTLTKDEIRSRWEEIWALTSGIVRQLREPPVYYPGEEFTEEAYREFYLDGGTALHAALSPEGDILGILETNRESADFLGNRVCSVNVGEAFVLPPYRGCGLSRALLVHAAAFERERGADCLWVEHGTANPAARGFWGRYFTPCLYELTRTVNPCPLP